MDGIEATAGAGLMVCLTVGINVGKSIAAFADKPFVAVNHLEGHALSPGLENKIDFPYLLLLISGGHSQYLIVKDINEYVQLGTTIDDAVGEAFDKTAKILGLGYPGGPALAKLATKGVKDRFIFPRPMTDRPGLDFSFSGLKTAVLYLVKKQANLTEEIKADIAYAFEESITDVLVKKTIQALKQEGLKRVIIYGGVGANKTLRRKIIAECKQNEFEYYFPDLSFCTDNGAMIALAGALRLNIPNKENYSFSVKPRWKLTEI